MQASTLFKTSYNYLLLLAVAIVVTSFSVHSASDFHWHDTYIVIPDKIVILLCAAVLIFIWGVYYQLRKVLLARWLTWLHVLSLLALVIVVISASWWYHPLTALSRRGSVSFKDIDEDRKRMLVIVIPFTLAFLAGLLAFFINTIGGCIRYIVKKNR